MANLKLTDVGKAYGGSVEVLKNINLDIQTGELIVFVGPSGCGKSTLLRMIAGLEKITSGELTIDGDRMNDVPPAQRGIAMVFQSYALYPHMTVRDNMAFALKLAKKPKEEIDAAVEKAAKVLQLDQYLDRLPKALSGGQRQRVAIGRSIVRDPKVYLFDEPLSNLDAKLRTDLRVEIKRLHQQLQNTMIYVTHDQVEAMTLADRIAIMKDGIIQQLDDPNTIYAKPRNKYVADFIGSPAMNFFKGDIKDGSFSSPEVSMDLKGYETVDGNLPNTNAWLGIRPEHIQSGANTKGCSFVGDATIEIVDPMGSDTLVWASLAGQSIRVRTEGQSSLKVGETLKIGFNADKLSIFDTDTELRV